VGQTHARTHQALSDLGGLYREEIESRIAAVRPRLGEKGVEEELKAITQTVSLLESEGRKNRSATRKEELLNSAAALRREIESMTEENKRKQLLSKSAKVMDEEEGGLLDEDAKEILGRSADNLARSKRNLVRGPLYMCSRLLWTDPRARRRRRRAHACRKKSPKLALACKKTSTVK